MTEIIRLGDKIVQNVSRAAIDSRTVSIKDEFQAPEWLIKGMIPEGVGVIAGSGGVGKTTCIVPLVLAVAGFKSPSCNIDVEVPRKIIYLSEDPGQVMRIIQGMRKFLKWDDATWERLKNHFLLVESIRMSAVEFHDFLVETLPYGVMDPIYMQPLVVIDTTAANLGVMNESDNSEVSEYMEILKSHYTRHKASSILITHLTKVAKGQSIDDIMNFGSRGAGAWNDNAHWTAALSTDGENGEGNRILKMAKKRADVSFDEIVFEGSLQQANAINRFGEEVVVNYRYTVPRKSSKDNRISEKMEKKNQELSERIIEAIGELDYPSKNDVYSIVKGDKTTALNLIKTMISNGLIFELDLPPELRKKNSKTYLSNHPGEF